MTVLLMMAEPMEVKAQVSIDEANTVLLYSHDSSVVWAVYTTKLQNNTFEVVAMGKGKDGKVVSPVASLSINDLYGVTIEKKMTKNVNKDKQVNMAKEVHVKSPGKYTISGAIHYYVEGDVNIYKKNFQLTFKN